MAADAITYVDDAAALTLDDLATFFEGWRAAPAPDLCLGAVTDADACVLAFDGHRLVGFATALTDRSLFAFIPLVEVVASHRGRGIGSELVRRVSRAVEPIYGVYVCCDEDTVGFYERLGFDRVVGMVRLNLESASLGREPRGR
ncbi:MAG TPA: GNAT family N-acetyltransferase [Actinomycetota bacterium]|nr:GNAT family N-acetyltransferase [Actinomycetota bacterium]